MKLAVYKRTKEKKSELAKIRQGGDIPAVLCTAKGESQTVFVKGREFEAFLRSIRPGHLSTQIIEISLEGKKFQGLIKEVQYHRTSYKVEHIDFYLLQEERPVVLNVPIELEGAADCLGVKKGGMVRQIVRRMKVRCLPKDIPFNFKLDVSGLDMGESKRLLDITLPSSIKPLAKLKEVLVTVVKR